MCNNNKIESDTNTSVHMCRKRAQKHYAKEMNT